MDLIIDANLLFAALIKESKTTDLILDLRLQLFAPKFLLKEFNKYEEQILKKTNRSKEEFNEIFILLNKIINIIPEGKFKNKLKEAKEISPDPKDEAYFALALKLNCGIWSNDKILKKQDKIKVYSTKDLIRILKG